MRSGLWQAAFLLWMLLGMAAAEEGGILEYHQATRAEMMKAFEYPTYTEKRLEPLTEEPELKAIPSFTGTPVYFSFELGEAGSEPYTVAFDAQANNGKGLFYLDTDRDGDLAEEDWVLPDESSTGRRMFGPVAVTVERDGAQAPYHFWIAGAGGQGAGSIWLRPAGYNVGEVTFLGQPYKAATFDDWTDGVFNSICWSRRGQGDLLYLDFDGDGRFGREECLLVAERGWHDGKWYKMAISADGTKVVFDTLDVPFGTLRVDAESFSVQMTTLSNLGSITVEGKDGRVDVPADRYSLYLGKGTRTGKDGSVWNFETTYGGPYPRFEVPAGKESDFRVGPPFTVALKATPDPPYRAGQTIELSATVTGSDSKRYRFKRNGMSCNDVNLVVKDDSGTVLASYTIEQVYGGSGLHAASLTLPADFQGKLIVTPEMDLGPFQVNSEDLVIKVE